MTIQIQLLIIAIVATLFFAGGWEVHGWYSGSLQTAAVTKQLDDRVGDENVQNNIGANTVAKTEADTKKADEIIDKEKANEDKAPSGYSAVVPADGLRSLRDLAATRKAGR